MKRFCLLSKVFCLVFIALIAVLFSAQTQAADLKIPDKTIVLVSDWAYPPWVSLEQDKPTGFEGEVITKIFDMFGVKYEIKVLPFETSVQSVVNGSMDVVFGGMDITCERRKVLDHASPIFTDMRAIVVQKGSGISFAEAFCCGAKVGTQGTASWYVWLEDMIKKNKMDVDLRGYETPKLAMQDLDAGNLDSVLTTVTNALTLIREGGYNTEIRAILPTMSGKISQDSFFVTRGDPHGLIPIINEGLKKLSESGEWNRLYNEWFPGKAVLQVPQQSELKCE